MIMEGSWLQAIIVHGKHHVMFILEYISSHGAPEWCAARMEARSPRVPYRHMSNPVHHAQAYIGSTRGQRDPLQLAEHSGDAAGIMPAIADVPGRATLHHL